MEWKFYENIFLDKSIIKMDWFNSELNKVRAGRITAEILDDVLVESYGTQIKIIEIANIRSIDARQLLIKPYDSSQLRDITHAISLHNIGANPIIDADTIKLTFPALSEETRKQLVKKIKEISESTKIGIRNIRKEIHSKINRDEDLTKDDIRYYINLLDNLVKNKNIEIDKLISEKEKDLMKI